VLEGTYGDRNHDDRKQRRECLASTIERAVEDLGAVIIPAFSLGRTQELLYEIEAIITERVQLEEGRGAWSDLAVIVDSPLASKFTKIYRRLKPYWNDEAQLRLKMGRRPLNFSKMLIVDNHLAHERVVEHLRDTARPVIVISASGMCNGGRIVNYLKALLPDPRTDILFVGYQSSDSVGRDIQQGVKSILLDGDEVEVRAKVHTIKGFSAHTDQSGLRRFVKGIQDPPKEIRIVHGDDKAKLMLQNLLSQDLPAANVWVP
jgi:metallo-beta-lactamase family protein